MAYLQCSYAKDIFSVRLAVRPSVRLSFFLLMYLLAWAWELWLGGYGLEALAWMLWLRQGGVEKYLIAIMRTKQCKHLFWGFK